MKYLVFIFITFINYVYAQSAQQQVNSGDKLPQYPGGIGNAVKFISKNLIYPGDASSAGAEGHAIVKFVIDSTGVIRDPVIFQTTGWPSLDQEAIRLVSKMPNWSAAEQNHKKVSIYFNLPIVFSLHDSPSSVKQKQLELSNIYFSNGLKDVELKKYEDAKKNFKNAYSLNVANTDALYNLAAMYHTTHMIDSACVIWNKLKNQYNKDLNEFLTKYCNN